MVVAPFERNVIDQRGVEEQLWRAHRVPMMRLSLGQLHASAVLSTDGQRRLRVAAPLGGEVEVSVVYFRAGYAPGDYEADSDWSARELVERSVSSLERGGAGEGEGWSREGGHYARSGGHSAQSGGHSAQSGGHSAQSVGTTGGRCSELLGAAWPRAWHGRACPDLAAAHGGRSG